MAKKTPPSEMYPKWTRARYWSFIRSALRKAFTRYPPRFECLSAASRPYTGTDKRKKKEYQCAECKEWFVQKNVQVDHIEPCGSLRTYRDLAGFVKRLFCHVDGLRVLCIECHKKITQENKK